mgnify:FL=1
MVIDINMLLLSIDDAVGERGLKQKRGSEMHARVIHTYRTMMREWSEKS